MTLSHSELARLIKNDDQGAFTVLKSDFDSMIRGIVSGSEVVSAEAEDLYQEGLIGLYKAAMTYCDRSDASFPTYARVCIKHSIISALRIYYGKKNYPVRSSLSLDSDEESIGDIRDLGQVTEPECVLIEKESYEALLRKIDVTLSKMECEVLKLFLEGLSYGEISKRLRMSTKSVGNAIQRIRGKLKLFIQA